MHKLALVWLVLVLILVAPTAGFASDEETFEDPAASTSTSNDVTAEAAPVSEPPAAQAAAPETVQSAPADERNEALSVRLRELVKRLDAADRNGKVFPSKNIEAAIRAEFMRRTEGNNSLSWLPKRNTREADISVAQDNLELFLAYSERLLSLAKSNKKATKKEEDEAKAMSAKAVIDEYNGIQSKKSGRSLASLGSTPQGLSQVGKGELARRRRLVGGLVSGDDFRPLKVKKVDDIGKAYKAALTGAVKEYEAMAATINKKVATRKGK